MGEVCRAAYSRLGREVAIKVANSLNGSRARPEPSRNGIILISAT
jgi:hypothetical protein